MVARLVIMYALDPRNDALQIIIDSQAVVIERIQIYRGIVDAGAMSRRRQTKSRRVCVPLVIVILDGGGASCAGAPSKGLVWIQLL